MSSIGIRSVGLDFAPASVAVAGFWKLIHVLERLIAAVLLLLTAPALLAAAIAVVLLSGRAPFVAHLRIAQGGRPLWVLKLRTMWRRGSGQPRRRIGFLELLPPEIPDGSSPKSSSDPRVTSAFAAFCRRHSLDELPQLWHVVRGEMALVGPRPLTEYELDRYYGSAAVAVLSRRPGLSGLWQIRGRSRLNYRRRRRLDLFLVRHWSLKLYLRILFTTLHLVISGKDAW
ncbi:MAG TPA: sugar transferase [Bryobacteraceae bacterium]